MCNICFKIDDVVCGNLDRNLRTGGLHEDLDWPVSFVISIGEDDINNAKVLNWDTPKKLSIEFRHWDNTHETVSYTHLTLPTNREV